MVTESNTAILILAAGAASRMGSAKQLLKIKGKSMVEHAIGIATQTGCQDVLLVTGAHAEEIKAIIADTAMIDVAYNKHWQEGIGTSIRAGIEHILRQRPYIQATIIMLCDQPMVTAALLSQLIKVHRNTGKGMVACRYENTVGVPALFGRAFFKNLAALQGDAGAKKIIRQYPDAVAYIPFDSAAIDIDTRSDYDDFIDKYV